MNTHSSPRTSFAVVCALFAATFVTTPREDVAVLDRLAPRIERAQTLAPEARDAIMRLVDGARASTGNSRYDVRRSATIERVADAIKARSGPELTSVGQGSRTE